MAASSFPAFPLSTRVIQEKEEECRQGQAAEVREEGRRVLCQRKQEEESLVNGGVFRVRRALTNTLMHMNGGVLRMRRAL